ncbi:YadA-like family protein [[Pasteurella] aerogenes]
MRGGANQNVYSWTDNQFKIGEWNKCGGSNSVQLSDNWNDCSNSDYVAIGKNATVGVVSLKNDEKSGMVAIGSNSNALGAKAIALGMLAKTKEGAGQAIAIGNNAGANSQSVALGADVYALGKSSVAIGNDDIDDSRFDDKLPINEINTIFKKLKDDNSYFGTYNNRFEQLYVTGSSNGKQVDNRKYSPTYAAGVGAIAIGSRTVAAGDLSTSVGALSFALADYSTTLGMRSFVARSAKGGVAVGQASRVFSPNSLAIGNFNEATSNGSMSYGYNAKAVGEHTIAIGSIVAAGAKFDPTTGQQWLDLYKSFNKNSTDLDSNDEFDTKATTILKNGNTNGSETMPLTYDSEIILTIGGKDIKKIKPHGETGAGKNAIVIGGRSFALWENSLALGYSALADASNGFAIGSYAYAGNRATNAMAIGVRSYAEGVNSIALGYRARVQDESKNTEFLKSISADKNQDSYKGTNSIALGIESLAYLNNSVALGHKSQTDYLYADLLHKANALRNGEAGTVVYTDNAGQRLVKANDGKYYHATDVENNGVPKSGKSAVENPQLSLVNAQGNTDKAALLGNVASGLGVKTPTAEENAQLNALAKVVDEKVEIVGERAKTLADKAQTFTDLTLAVSSLEQAVDAMPEGETKEKAQVMLQQNKAKLAQTKAELETAKAALTTAKAQLSDANKAYDNRYNALTGASDKIADLVNADSRAALTHAATVADLQAVARAGLNVVGNDGLTVHKHLGETLSITGEGEFNSDTSAAGNIKVELAQDGQGLSVKLSDKLQGMTSVETREIHGKKSLLNSNGLKTVSADSETRVSAQGTEIVGKGANAGKAAGYRLDGVRLQDGAGNHATLSAQQGLRLTGQAGEPSLIATKNGLVVKGAQGDIALDGQRGEILLPNVKPDASGYVAVNKNYVDSQNNELRTQLSNTNREMRAGIAGALAAASLPSSAIPGKSMLAASAGAFKGHSAIALGYSKMSDNGKISIRLQGTSNSAGDLGGAVGVGYLW